MKAFFASLIAAIVAFFGTISTGIIDAVNNYEFTVDASETGRVLANPASNINIWSIDGDPFVNAQINEENNIFDFVNYVQFMQCTGGSAERDLFVDPYNREVLDDYDENQNRGKQHKKTGNHRREQAQVRAFEDAMNSGKKPQTKAEKREERRAENAAKRKAEMRAREEDTR